MEAGLASRDDIVGPQGLAQGIARLPHVLRAHFPDGQIARHLALCKIPSDQCRVSCPSHLGEACSDQPVVGYRGVGTPAQPHEEALDPTILEQSDQALRPLRPQAVLCAAQVDTILVERGGRRVARCVERQVGVAEGRLVEPQRVEWRAAPASVQPDTQAMQPTDELGTVHLSL